MRPWSTVGAVVIIWFGVEEGRHRSSYNLCIGYSAVIMGYSAVIVGYSAVIVRL